MSYYTYSPLSSSSRNIRLLRLLPHADPTADIQCELFEYPLLDPQSRSHLYEALSYVWGDPSNKPSIVLNGYPSNVTANLHAALSHLRNHSLERILWVDAICIDQNNAREKEEQIQLMAEVYGRANRVVVWLGEAADDSDIALEIVQIAESKPEYLGDTRIQQAVGALFERPWFRRIWVRKQTFHVLYINP